MAVDAKQGIRKVNLLCEELKSKELAEQLKQEKLKLKKKKKKERRIEAEAEAEAEEKENINNVSFPDKNSTEISQQTFFTLEE